MNFSFTLNVVKIQIFAIVFGVFLFSLSYSAYTYASSAITEINVNQMFNSTQVIDILQ